MNYRHTSPLRRHASKKATKEFNLTKIHGEFLIFRYRERRLSIIWTSYTPTLGGHKIVFYEREEIHSWLGR